MPRAVKMLQAQSSTENRDQFIREAEVMQQLVHPHICQMVAVDVAFRPNLVVLELLPYGDLKGILEVNSFTCI
jgi:serine/threonine protein kinase